VETGHEGYCLWTVEWCNETVTQDVSYTMIGVPMTVHIYLRSLDAVLVFVYVRSYKL